MTKARNDYIYHLIGQILSKGKRTSQEEKYQGIYYYQLNVKIENKEVKKIFAFPTTLASKQIWTQLENDEYLDKRYTFLCKNYRGYYRLIDWEELTTHAKT